MLKRIRTVYTALPLRIIGSMFVVASFFAIVGGVFHAIATLSNSTTSLDFLQFYNAAQMLISDKAHLYDLSVQSAKQHALVPLMGKSFFPFFYPPFVIILFLPLSHFSLVTAYLLWLMFNILLLLMLCYFSFDRCSMVKVFLSGVTLFIFPPILLSLLFGHATILLTILFFASWFLLKKEKPFLSGIFISFLLIKPQFFFLPLLMFLIQRQDKVLLGIFVGGLSLLLLSFLLVGWEGIVHYLSLLQIITTWNRTTGLDSDRMYTLQALFMLVFHTSAMRVQLPWLLATGVVILAMSVVWRIKPRSSEIFDLQWMLLIVGTLLASVYVHYYDFSLLLLVGILIIRNRKRVSLNAKRRLDSVFLSGVLVLYSVCCVEVFSEGRLHFVSVFLGVGFLMYVFLLLLFSLLRTVRVAHA